MLYISCKNFIYDRIFALVAIKISKEISALLLMLHAANILWIYSCLWGGRNFLRSYTSPLIVLSYICSIARHRAKNAQSTVMTLSHQVSSTYPNHVLQSKANIVFFSSSLEAGQHFCTEIWFGISYACSVPPTNYSEKTDCSVKGMYVVANLTLYMTMGTTTIVPCLYYSAFRVSSFKEPRFHCTRMNEVTVVSCTFFKYRIFS